MFDEIIKIDITCLFMKQLKLNAHLRRRETYHNISVEIAFKFVIRFLRLGPTNCMTSKQKF